MNSLQTPDVTLAQLLAAFTWIVAQAVTIGFVDNNQSALILQVGTTGLSAVWVIADAIIRNGRARAFMHAPKGEVADDGDSNSPLAGSGKGA